MNELVLQATGLTKLYPVRDGLVRVEGDPDALRQFFSFCRVPAA